MISSAICRHNTMVASSPCLPSMRYLFDLTLPVYHWSLLFPLMVSTYYKSYIDHFSFFLICFKIAYPSHSCFFQFIPRSMFFVIIFFILSIASASRSSFKLHFSVIFFSTSLLSLLRIHLSQIPRVGELCFGIPLVGFFILIAPVLPTFLCSPPLFPPFPSPKTC